MTHSLRKKNWLKTISLVWLLGILSSCGTYYKLKSLRVRNKENFAFQITKENTVVFVHGGTELLQLENINLYEDFLEGTIVPIHKAEVQFYNRIMNKYNQKAYFRPGKIAKTRNQEMEKAVKEDTLNLLKIPIEIDNRKNRIIHQVHLYVSKIEANGQVCHIAFTNIDRSLVFKKSVNPGMVLVYGTVAFAAMIGIACNCPHIYTDNGTTMVYTNTLFTGAVSEKLERFDYKSINDFFPTNSSFSLQIRNEDHEKQFTNLLGLTVAYHDPSFQVLPDLSGKLYSVQTPLSACGAQDQDGQSCQASLAENDGNYFSFQSPTKNGLVTANLKFHKPTDVTCAKLILDLKNSDWAGYIHQQFMENLGTYHSKWLASNEKLSTKAQLDAMKKAGIPLVVYLKCKNKWMEVQTIQALGNATDQSIVIPIDPSLLTETTIEIRIESGFNLWEIDYAGMDFSNQQAFEIQHLSPSFVSGSDTNLTALSENDQNYLVSEIGSKAIDVRFEGLKTIPKLKRTIIIESKGFYVRQALHSGQPNWSKLALMKRKNGIGRFSQEEFLHYLQNYTQLSGL